MPRKQQVTSERLVGLITQIESLGFAVGGVLDDTTGSGTFAHDVRPMTSDLLIVASVARDLAGLVSKLVMQQEMRKQLDELERYQAEAEAKRVDRPVEELN